ncbi:MAG: hypothetical protein ACXWCV_00870 [Caldimonas sp.]
MTTTPSTLTQPGRSATARFGIPLGLIVAASLLAAPTARASTSPSARTGATALSLPQPAPTDSLSERLAGGDPPTVIDSRPGPKVGRADVARALLLLAGGDPPIVVDSRPRPKPQS